MEGKSKYQLSTSIHEGIIEITITGEVTVNAVKELENEIFAIIRVESVRTRNLIVDVRALKGRFGFTEAYFRVRNYPPDRPRMNTAVVDIEENAAFQSFHETTASNAGVSLKWFTNMDAARAWHKSRQSEDSRPPQDSS